MDEFRKAAKKTRTVAQKMVKAANQAAKKPILANYVRESGGDGNLSGTRSQWKFTAPTRVRGDVDVKGTVRMKPGGPASWRNYGTVHTAPAHTFDEVVPEAIEAARREIVRVFHQEYS